MRLLLPSFSSRSFLSGVWLFHISGALEHSPRNVGTGFQGHLELVLRPCNYGGTCSEAIKVVRGTLHNHAWIKGTA